MVCGVCCSTHDGIDYIPQVLCKRTEGFPSAPAPPPPPYVLHRPNKIKAEVSCLIQYALCIHTLKCVRSTGDRDEFRRSCFFISGHLLRKLYIKPKKKNGFFEPQDQTCIFLTTMSSSLPLFGSFWRASWNKNMQPHHEENGSTRTHSYAIECTSEMFRVLPPTTCGNPPRCESNRQFRGRCRLKMERQVLLNAVPRLILGN